MIINIVGLGPGNIGSLTLDAVDKIKDKNPNYLRTEKHPTVEYFKNNNIVYKSFDYVYDREDNFENVYSKIVEELIENARKFNEINYFVPGNPMVAENTVSKLLKSSDEDLTINLGTGLSFIEPMLEGVRHDAVNGLSIIDGINFSFSDININSDCIITQVYSQRVASDLKLILSEVYGDEYLVYLINSGGIMGEEEILKIPIYEVDRNKNIGDLTSLFIPKIEKDNKIYGFSDIIQTVAKLRDIDGCPWDRKQDFKSLRKYLLEETYELINAVDNDDIDNIIEELGDVLLQVIFYSQIGYEDGEFNIYDVISHLNDKLIHRHPHVFSNTVIENEEELRKNWDELKKEEKSYKKISDSISDLPQTSLLMKSYKIQEKVSKVGFDWDNIQGPLDKVIEEYNEILEIINDEKSSKNGELEGEIGDLLFSVVNLSRFLKVDPNIALKKTIDKFIKRFTYIEESAINNNMDLKNMSLEEMDKLWNKAKKS